VRPGEPDSYRSGGVRINQNNPLNTSTAGAAPGSQVFPGFQPTIGGVSVVEVNSRENVSAYVELYPSGGGRLVWAGSERSLACSFERA